jgi:hypothetical protein
MYIDAFGIFACLVAVLFVLSVLGTVILERSALIESEQVAREKHMGVLSDERLRERIAKIRRMKRRASYGCLMVITLFIILVLGFVRVVINYL